MTSKEIVAQVAARHGVSVDDLIGPSRQRTITRARHEAMWLMRQATTRSLPSIGRVFRRHHTTVLFGIREHEERRAKLRAAA